MDDQTEKLKAYIKQQLQAGLQPDEVEQQLQTSGWPPETAHQAFLAVQAGMVPASIQASTPAAPAANQSAVPPPQAIGTGRGRIKTGWLLLKQSARILNGNRYLLRYLLMTYVTVMIASIIFVVIFIVGRNLFFDPNAADPNYDLTLIGIPIVFASYVVIYFLVNYYAAALAANVLQIFLGKSEPFSAYTKLARSKAPAIFMFSLIEATVGMILRFLVERIRFVGWILAWLLGTAWSLGTMFVLPIIVTSDTSAPRAIKQSITFFKSTWGENITAKVTVNAPLFLINLLVILMFLPLFFITFYNGTVILALFLIVIYGVIQLSIAIVGSFANSLINISLFYYAAYHQIPPSFDADLLNHVFVKKKRRLFGKKDPAAS